MRKSNFQATYMNRAGTNTHLEETNVYRVGKNRRSQETNINRVQKITFRQPTSMGYHDHRQKRRDESQEAQKQTKTRWSGIDTKICRIALCHDINTGAHCKNQDSTAQQYPCAVLGANSNPTILHRHKKRKTTAAAKTWHFACLLCMKSVLLAQILGLAPTIA